MQGYLGTHPVFLTMTASEHLLAEKLRAISWKTNKSVLRFCANLNFKFRNVLPVEGRLNAKELEKFLQYTYRLSHAQYRTLALAFPQLKDLVEEAIVEIVDQQLSKPGVRLAPWAEPKVTARNARIDPSDPSTLILEAELTLSNPIDFIRTVIKF